MKRNCVLSIQLALDKLKLFDGSCVECPRDEGLFRRNREELSNITETLTAFVYLGEAS